MKDEEKNTVYVEENTEDVNSDKEYKIDGGNSTFYVNTQEDILVIPEYKLKDYARRFEKGMKKNSDWLGYIGIILSLLICDFTSSFNDMFGLNGDFWKGAFYSVTLFMCISFWGKVIMYFYNKLFSDDYVYSVDGFIKICKNQKDVGSLFNHIMHVINLYTKKYKIS